MTELTAQEAAERIEAALRESTPGRWCKGQTTHHTVAKFTDGRKPYAVAEFHHAADAEFAGQCHELLPILLAERRELLARQVQDTARLDFLEENPSEEVRSVLVGELEYEEGRWGWVVNGHGDEPTKAEIESSSLTVRDAIDTRMAFLEAHAANAKSRAGSGYTAEDFAAVRAGLAASTLKSTDKVTLYNCHIAARFYRVVEIDGDIITLDGNKEPK